MPPRKELVAIDLCAGAGGWACAARGLPIRMMLAVDLDPWALRTYQFNHPGTFCVQADVMEFDFRPLAGKVDLILAGIPCELISPARFHNPPKQEQIAGLRRLIDRLCKLPEAVDARWWCYEDVPSVVEHLPFWTRWQRINSARYSPQKRKRVYVGQFPPPDEIPDTRLLDDGLEEGPFLVTPNLYKGEPMTHNTYKKGTFMAWFRGRKARTVCNIFGSRKGHAGIPEDLEGRTFWRSISWREGARLQGFPEDYVFIGSQTKAEKLIAQAVQVDTGRAILRAICRQAGVVAA